MSKKEKVKNWINVHKKELIVGVVATAILIFVGLKAKELYLLRIADLEEGDDFQDSIDNIEKTIEITRVIEVREGIRNLPEGYKASDEKIAEAIAKGIELGPRQTIVDSYKKTIKTAA